VVAVRRRPETDGLTPQQSTEPVCLLGPLVSRIPPGDGVAPEEEAFFSRSCCSVYLLCALCPSLLRSCFSSGGADLCSALLPACGSSAAGEVPWWAAPAVPWAGLPPYCCSAALTLWLLWC
jgi:hypothetical protein